jgi:hypothetical protein
MGFITLLSFLKGTSTYVGHVSMSAYYLRNKIIIHACLNNAVTTTALFMIRQPNHFLYAKMTHIQEKDRSVVIKHAQSDRAIVTRV